MNHPTQKIVASIMAVVLALGISPSVRTPVASAAQKPEIVDVAIGVRHVLALDKDGGVWSWGNDAGGALGHGDRTEVPTPKKIESLPPVTAIAAGDYHSVALDRDGNVWVWGSNVQGQLGNGEISTLEEGAVTEDKGSKVPVKNGLGGIRAIYASGPRTIAIDREGQVYEWGGASHNSGMEISEESLRESVARLRPRKVEGLERIVSVAFHKDAYYALDESGQLWHWGLRLEDKEYRHIMIPEPMPGLDNVKQIRTREGSVWAQEQDGTWKQWGYELFYYDLFIKPSSPWASLLPVNREPVASAQMQGFGQIEVSDTFIVGLKPDGSVWIWDHDKILAWKLEEWEMDGWTQVELAHPVTKVAAFDGTAFAITEGGSLYAWGYNNWDKLGDGSVEGMREEPRLLAEFGTDEEKPPEPGTRIYLNGKRLDFEAVFIRGTAMVPFRDLFGAYNMNVDWDQQTRTVTARKEGLTIQLAVGSRTAYVNGEKRELSEAPVAQNGKTFVNLRFISEALGARVVYTRLSADSSEIRITTRAR